MLWGAWYTGVKWHSPFSMYWLKVVLGAPIPVWFTLPIIIAALIAAWKGYTAYRLWKGNSISLEKTLADLRNNEPKLHGIWNNTQTFWTMGRYGNAPMMQIGGWIQLTSSNTKDVLHLLAAYINDKRSQVFMQAPVEPYHVNRVQVVLYMVPPLTTDATKPFTATIVVEDQLNRRYLLPAHEFRPIPAGQTPSPQPNVEKGMPALHASWSR